MVRVIVGWMCALAVAATTAEAAVVCKKKSGALVVRDECKKKESPVTLSEFGAVGPQGPAGADGAQGPIGPSNGYATSFSTSVDLLEDGTPVTLLSIDVPGGSYVATAHIEDITITDPQGPLPETTTVTAAGGAATRSWTHGRPASVPAPASSPTRPSPAASPGAVPSSSSAPPETATRSASTAAR
jgi:hypothetical protein